MVAAIGISTLTFGRIFFQMVNPDNLTANIHEEDNNAYFSDYKGVDVSVVANRVPGTFRLLALIYLVFTIIGSSLLFSPERVTSKFSFNYFN